MIGKGRRVLLTSYKEINADNVIEVVQDAFKLYRENAEDCEFLLNYASGEQPLQRKSAKKVMTWIDCEAVDNIALEISDFWRGFGWGNPITLVQRGDIKDAEGKAEGISELNYCYAATGNSRDLQSMANFIVKCGHCYTITDINTEYEPGDSYFTRDVVDPRWAFVVRSIAYPDQRVVLSVSLNVIENDYFLTATTKERIFNIKAEKTKVKTSTVKKEKDFYKKYFTWTAIDEAFDIKNALGVIPITEWYWEPDRVGVFENQINALDNLNLIASDISNGIEQNIQAIWWSNNVEFEKEVITDEEGNEKEVIIKPKDGDWLMTKTAREGVNPSIQPLVMDYHIGDMLKSFTEMRTLVLQKCHVPQRSETSGGSSGVAMDSAAGWSDAESIASSREEIVKGCQMDEIRVALRAIKESPFIKSDNPMLNLYPNDVQPAIRRPKTADINTRVNGIATLLSHGFSLEDCVSNIPLFGDATQVIQRSGEGVAKYQDSIFNNENSAEEKPNSDRTMQDTSDQVERSPLLKL